MSKARAYPGIPDYRRNPVAGGTFFFMVSLLDGRSDLSVTQVDSLRDGVLPALGAAEFVTLSIIRWSHMLVTQCRGSAAEFRCQSPADPVLGPGIPLPEGSEKLHARPCYRMIIRR